MSMQRVWILVALGTLLVAAVATEAKQRKVKYSKGAKNNDAITYTDLHVEITSDTNMTLGDTMLWDDGTKHTPTSTTGDGTHTIQVNFEGLEVPKDDTVGLSIRFTQNEKNTYKIKKSWTRPASDPSSDALTIPPGQVGVEMSALGLRVEPNGDFFLTNDYNQEITVNNFEYTVMNSPLPQTDDQLAQMMESIAAGSPFPYSWTGLAVGPASPLSDTFVTNLTIAEDQYLYSFFEENFTGTATDVGYTLLEHEHQVIPEPTSMVLLFGGLALLRRKRR